jgi:primase-polymerase (primpol)-like protein
MQALQQFLTWRLIQKPDKPKPDKVPFDAKTCNFASVSDPSTWCNYAYAIASYNKGGYDGIGFVFTDNDPFIFLDIDDCIIDGVIQNHALQVIQALPSFAWETSQSGKGLHGIGKVADKAIFKAKANRWKGFEFYSQGRFVAFGKHNWSRLDMPLVSNTETAYLLDYIPDRAAAPDIAIDWDTPAPDPSEDNAIIMQIFMTPLTYNLYAGQDLGSRYPDEGGKRPFDNSSAEFALAVKLAKLTNGNAAWIERLMTASPLCQREKWQKRPDYRRSTIQKAVSAWIAVERQKRIEEDKLIGESKPEFKITPDLMDLNIALNRFVYVSNGSYAVDRQTKSMFSYADCERTFAASKILIDGKDVPVVKAWLNHPERKTVDNVTWAPGSNEFCHALESMQSGNRCYNSWRGFDILPCPENWQELLKPFLQHVEYLIPDAVERRAFLSWIAHAMQKPHELPHFHFLMISPMTGTGRGTLASILCRVFRGYFATNVSPDALFGGFNGRLSQKIIASIDEVREGNAYDRWQKSEKFKSTVTEETRLINPKYGLQSVEKNCMRFLMFSNHDDALPFDHSDRRIYLIRNPEIRRTPSEYRELHSLLKNDDFIASVQHYFQTLDISDFDAFEPAPMNTAKQAALRSLESDIDKACREFKETWPADFATVSDLKNFIGDEGARVNMRNLNHSIDRAGMQSGIRLNVGNKRGETLLIVKGHVNSNDFQSINKPQLAEIITKARIEFYNVL